MYRHVGDDEDRLKYPHLIFSTVVRLCDLEFCFVLLLPIWPSLSKY